MQGFLFLSGVRLVVVVVDGLEFIGIECISDLRVVEMAVYVRTKRGSFRTSLQRASESHLSLAVIEQFRVASPASPFSSTGHVARRLAQIWNFLLVVFQRRRGRLPRSVPKPLASPIKPNSYGSMRSDPRRFPSRECEASPGFTIQICVCV